MFFPSAAIRVLVGFLSCTLYAEDKDNVERVEVIMDNVEERKG